MGICCLFILLCWVIKIIENQNKYHLMYQCPHTHTQRKYISRSCSTMNNAKICRIYEDYHCISIQKVISNTGMLWHIYDQSSTHIETSQMICSANQLVGSCMSKKRVKKLAFHKWLLSAAIVDQIYPQLLRA